VAQNPYYTYDDDYGIKYSNGKMFAIEDNLQTLVVVREYFKRVFEHGFDIKFMHIYSHVGEKEQIKIKGGETIESKDKAITLEDNSIFEKHTLFVGNRKADKLAEEATK
jgi:hypothetical protein